MTKYGKILADGTLKLCNGTIKVNGRYKTNPSKSEAAQAGYYPIVDIPDDKMPPTGRNGLVWSKRCYRVVKGMILPMCVLEKPLTTISEPYTDKIIMEKINDIVKRVAKSASVILLMLFPLIALSDDIITVRTARKDKIFNDAQIVTNVDFNASVLESYIANAPHVPYETDSEMPGWMMVFSPMFLLQLEVDSTATFNGDIVAGLPSSSVWLPSGWGQLRTGTPNGYLSSQTLPQYLSANISPISEQITTLGSQVNAIGSYLNAEDARFVSTNYDSVTRIPEAYVEVRLNDHGTNKWVEIWREMRRWNAFAGTNFNWDTWIGFHAFQTNVTSELAYKADRAWGAYDSETGGWSPEGFTQISSTNILIASGMAYQRTVTSDGAVWVLQCNNGVAQIGGDTNGYFRIMDADGNTQFEIIKGDRREMGADASGITVNGNVMTIPYSVEAAEHPVIQCTATLEAPNWKNETDGDCPCTVSWSGTSGAWVATVTPKSASPSMFVKATYIAGGETYIRNVAPVGMDSIILNGTKYYLGTATISGHTVLTLSTTAP